MAEYANITGRAALTNEIMPDQVVTDVIKEAETSSILLGNARKIPMSKKKYRQPVLSKTPKAYWVDGDTGLKQTTDVGFENLTITAEEMATIVPIPDAVVDDSDLPLWDAVKPLVVEALGTLLDEAGLFGTSKPASFPEGLIPGAITSSQVVKHTASADLGVEIAQLGETMSKNGVAPTGFIGRPGLNWSLAGLRDKNGQAIYTPANLATGQSAAIYGYTLNEVRSGAWAPQSAELVAVDWDKVLVGVRQDVTFDLFREGVITDQDGKVILNLMQQDSKALRVVFRVGFQVAQPYSKLTGKKIYPAGVITPAGV